MNDMIVGIISGVIATYVAKWLQYIFIGSDNIKIESDNSKKQIDKIKREFYFCFPCALLLVIISKEIPSGTFLSVAVIASTTILFVLSLFAFMCAIDIIENQFDNNSYQDPNTKLQ
ncbi:hypothetical protein DEAC_c17360 [Desulfosporosinus acididurans]|uniref:Uncharacterized protein n=1 Tax=Desulfosporosinus acididurans TaxID=476652 RepID=A0A0J1FSQ7_9FIRM|nr:hypothetical protein [Desulfosporosinus acididurans]KLU66337.1 hypothetical protein DEAC_c17360 [Desulfosporosinus acididurans]